MAVIHPAPSEIRPFFIHSRRNRPIKAHHLRFREPISWTYARDVQNAIIKAYQARHHDTTKILPPTFMTFRFNPVFTYGRQRDQRPFVWERKMIEGLPGPDGLATETRMAWDRPTGWRFHGPGQVHFWMVADMDHYNVCLPCLLLFRFCLCVCPGVDP